jgi:predicted amidohydrolase YtcJ
LYAEAVAIKGNRVIAIGKKSEIEKLRNHPQSYHVEGGRLFRDLMMPLSSQPYS